MKKLVCLIMTVALLFTTAETAFAKKHNDDNKNDKKQEQRNDTKDNKQEFKIGDSPVIKYDKFIIPLAPITKGMGAKVTFDKATATLTVSKGTAIVIVINLKAKTVNVNNVPDTNSGIFSAKNSKKSTVLIKYIAKLLGYGCEVDDDEIIVEVPGLDRPTKIILNTEGSTNVNTLNKTTLSLYASATITAGQAVGGKAELYVGGRLVATDSSIVSNDTTVTFTTSDGTPTNDELKDKVPSSGLVTVKLYNAYNSSVTSAVGNPTLSVDYISPTITGITSASYTAGGNQIKLFVTDASAVGDKVDVSKIFITDERAGSTLQLSSNSNGVVSNKNVIDINLSANDRAVLSSFNSTTTYLTITTGSLLSDAAGNVSPGFTTLVKVPLTNSNVLDLPTNVTVTPVGTPVVANTLNRSTLYLTATARITAGQATGGKAELYVGDRLVATDSSIASTDTTVDFITINNTITNAELQYLIPTGGLVTVKLYNASNGSVTSVVGNPTLIVDYVAPTITSFNSAFYNATNNQLYLTVSGASSIGDKVDVTKIVLYDTNHNGCQLANTDAKSNGSVISSDYIIVNIGPSDKARLNSIGTVASISISNGAFLTDAAGNASLSIASQSIQVTVIN